MASGCSGDVRGTEKRVCNRTVPWFHIGMRLSDVGHELPPQKPRVNRDRTARFIFGDGRIMHEPTMLTNW